MSFHVTNAEAEAQLRAQRRNSSIASVVIGLLLMTLVCLVFYLLKNYIFEEKVEPIVAFASDEVEEVTINKVKVKADVQKKPSAPSSSAVKVLAAQTTSTVAIPSPDVAVDSLSVDFGEVEGFGDSFGDGFAFGSGGNGEFNFLGSSGSANDVVFVIDWSASMTQKKGRMKLLQDEMRKLFSNIPNGSRMQVVMFCGPFWLASDENKTIGNIEKFRSSIFTTKDTKTGEVYKFKGSSPIEVKKKRVGKWVAMSDDYRQTLMDFVDKGELGFGTEWGKPLRFALEMKPAPKTVIFLTDGATGGNAKKIVASTAKLANEIGTVIKTVAMMEPKAEAEMRALAEKTGGSFTLVRGLSEKDREVTDYSKK